MKTEILVDDQDGSINIVSHLGRGRYFETRAVWRDNTLIIYLSSMSGCDLSCRMCHLTQTGQTSTTPSSIPDYLQRAEEILDYVKNKKGFDKVETLHFNFMARGDVLSNQYFTDNPIQVFEGLSNLAREFIPNIKPKFKLSTIFPRDINFDREYEFDVDGIKYWIVNNILDRSEKTNHEVEFYYSLYSLRPEFRKRWIPKAIDPEWIGQTFSGRDKGLRIHHALIAGENDTEEDIALIHEWLERHDLHVKFNIVQYNPYNDSCGKESDDDVIRTYVNQMKLSHRVVDIQIVSRVGVECYASCGTFFS